MILFGVMVLIIACKPGTPSQYIQPDEMEDILVEYHMARAMAQLDYNSQEREYNAALYIEAVLKKHGVNRALFDSSLVYYYTRADRFEPLYQRVQKRLEDQALALGASEGEIGKYASYNATGDTANIWPDRPNGLMLPVPPYNRWEFSIQADSSSRRGDELLLMFMSDYMYQTGTKSGMVYMAVQYEDTVIGHNLHFSVSGLSQLRVQKENDRKIRGIQGFFYLDGGWDPTPSTRLLFLNNVQLIRFHTIPEEHEPTDSIAQNSVGERQRIDSVSSGDTGGNGIKMLPSESGNSIDGVDARRDSPTP